MSNKFLTYSFLICSLVSFCCAQNIIRITSIVQIEQELQAADQTSLVVFDIDNVLLMTTDHCEARFTSQFIPVENKTVAIVKNLQERHVPVIALTASGTTFEICRWRIGNLQQIGLDLSGSFLSQEFCLDQFYYFYGCCPVFSQGILCAGRVPKGQALTAFLDKVEWKPSKVIFIDDLYLNCMHVYAQLVSCGIPVQCYWYCYAGQ